MAKTSNTSNPLINVSFTDATNNVEAIDTMDIVGVVVDTCWGPTDVFRVLDQAAWRRFADPLGLAKINWSWATVERVFEAGAQYVEVMRPSGNNTYMVFTVTPGQPQVGETPAVPESMAFQTMTADELNIAAAEVGTTYAAVIALRYPGGFDCKVTVKAYEGRLPGSASNPPTLSVITLSVPDATQDGEWREVETHTVSFTPYEAQGQSFFYADVLNGSSQYLTANPNYAYDTPWNPTVELAPTEDITSGYAELTDEEIAAGYALFTDRTQSQATILIPSVKPSNTSAAGEATTGYLNACKNIVNACDLRKDMCGLTGVPRETWGATAETTVENINAFVLSISQNSVMFWGAIAAWETYTTRNKTFYMDGTATWAGRMCSVAQQENNRNQLPSYIAFGRCNSVLYHSLAFQEVVNLMDDKGIGSIYSASNGNFIFNIRSQYFPQSSYFGKLNVGRVTAAVLHWLLPDVEGKIHTEVTSDSLQRLQFMDACNTKLGQQIARGELKAQSYIDIGDAINTDDLTNGGECLNIVAHLWYKKLTEEVKISIVATDTTSTVQITQG